MHRHQISTIVCSSHSSINVVDYLLVLTDSSMPVAPVAPVSPVAPVIPVISIAAGTQLFHGPSRASPAPVPAEPVTSAAGHIVHAKLLSHYFRL